MKNNTLLKITFLSFMILFSLVGIFSCNSQEEKQNKNLSFDYTIAAEGNTWAVGDDVKNSELVKEGGIKAWGSNETVFRTYFKTEQTGSLNVGIVARVVSGEAKLQILVGDKLKAVQVDNPEFDTIAVGVFNIEKPGYKFVEIRGLEKSGNLFPEIESILIGGEATNGKVYFAKEEFYWARRGPSVHLGFQIPENTGDVLYFYNEITVPENNDVVGSYFMANGFGQGYFGMQVNSPTERRILFSVWSPFTTDNPNEIPENQKIKLLKKGEDVRTGEFGNEGSGGQSFLKFNWKVGTTYKFLLKGQPTGKGETDFTAWFFAPEVNDWKLIASFRRPETNTYLTRLYSFLENFYTETGDVERRGLYSNQWAYTTKNEWVELTKIKFTADATARKESRMDYAGGLENGVFYLKNCGFYSETTPVDSYFERPATGISPVIDFGKLP